MTERTVIAPRPLAMAATAAVCLVLGAATQRADMVAVGVPFAVIAVVAALGGRSISGVTAHLDRSQIAEGDPVGLTVSVTGEPGTELVVDVPSTELLPRSYRIAAVTGADGRWSADLEAEPESWGRSPVPVPSVDVVDTRTAVRTIERPARFDGPDRLIVVPVVLAARHALVPRHLRAFGGRHRGPTPVDGVEFGETRPLGPGESWRRLNVRVSSRRGMPYVDDRHPDLAGDVTILLDTLAGGESEAVRRSAVVVAAAVADLQRRAEDRIGLLEIGGALRWLPAREGRRRTELLLEWLAGTHEHRGFVARDIGSIPPAALPRRGLVLAISPFVDPRSAPLLADLAARRGDVALVVIEPGSPPAGDGTGDDALAWRLWWLRREIEIERLAGAGVDVVRVKPPVSPVQLLLALSEARRRGRVA